MPRPAGAPDYCTPTAFRPVPDRLFRNDGDGTFADVTEAAGISESFGNGLGVAAADFDDDGWIDIYVANDATANQLWINRRDGRSRTGGCCPAPRSTPRGCRRGAWGSPPATIDNDGDEDLFVTNLPRETHTLYVNLAKGRSKT